MKILKKTLTLIYLSFMAVTGFGQEVSEKIRLNQVGFYPDGKKIAVIVGETASDQFQVKSTQNGKTVFSGKLTAVRPNEFSKKPTRIAEFSGFRTPGSYYIQIAGFGKSYAFDIKPNVHQEVAAAALKGFYFQRMSTDLLPEYAGKWHRKAGHTDSKAIIHPSAASPERPAGTIIYATRGWLDAGDYNKYIVNSGITMGTLLSAYEDFPEYFKKQKLNIPESNNPVPDILDEVLWNLRWMKTMQDPTDGGVYNKLTNPSFDGMVMPAEATKPRYVVQKGTAAALDFAAVMAQASRVYRNFNNQFPGLADSCLTASTRAWEWAQKNPNVNYDQNAMNEKFEPKITTGGYGDPDYTDEFTWAAAELYITTGKENYYSALKAQPPVKWLLPSWPQVRMLGFYTLARHQNKLNAEAKNDFLTIKKQVVDFADDLLKGVAERSYRTVMGKSETDYIWGSSAVAANQGIALLQAYKLTSDFKYLDAAIGNLDYLLGRNATGNSFLTGFGEKSTRNPHHRPSVADGIKEPVPGLLSGGTNARANKQDKCAGYADVTADEMYLDHDCSYASNEIAINWNAPFVYLVSAIEAQQPKTK